MKINRIIPALTILNGDLVKTQKFDQLNYNYIGDVLNSVRIFNDKEAEEIIITDIGSTINKTMSSFLLAIFLAENILNIVPKKTHSWKKFIKPNNLKKKLILSDFEDINFQGVIFNPLKNSWKVIRNVSVNYMFSSKLK